MLYLSTLLSYRTLLKGGITLDGIVSVVIFIILGVVLFLIIFYAVKFAIIEAHREINEQAKQAVEDEHSL